MDGVWCVNRRAVVGCFHFSDQSSWGSGDYPSKWYPHILLERYLYIFGSCPCAVMGRKALGGIVCNPYLCTMFFCDLCSK